MDGKTDGVGDVLSQGYAQDEVPDGGTLKTYVGPSNKFIEITTYHRNQDTSVFTTDLEKVARDLRDPYTDESFADGLEVSMASGLVPVKDEIKFGQVLISDLSMSGFAGYHKNVSADPAWPVASGIGGSAKLSVDPENKIMVSSASPEPLIVVTHKDTEEDMGNPPHHQAVIYFNNKTVSVHLKDGHAPLSQNRIVKYKWEVN